MDIRDAAPSPEIEVTGDGKITITAGKTLTLAPGALLEIKKVIRTLTIDACVEVAKKAMTMESARVIKTYLREELKKHVPELLH